MAGYTHVVFYENGSFAYWIKYQNGVYITPRSVLGNIARLEQFLALEELAGRKILCFDELNNEDWVTIYQAFEQRRLSEAAKG